MSSANIKISIDSKDKDKQLYSYLKVIGHIEEKDVMNIIFSYKIHVKT